MSLPGTGEIAWCDCTLTAVYAFLVGNVGSSHPRPLTTAELPEVVDQSLCPSRIGGLPTEEPDISRPIQPNYCTSSYTGYIADCCGTLNTVYTFLVRNVGASHPCPLTAAIFPKIIQPAKCSG